MFDVTAIGELLIDMAQLGMSDIGSPIFEANPGGAPCNVLAMLNKLGRSTAFIGKVGDDIFGKKLKKIVESSGTDIGGLVFDENVRTTLAFVETDEYGDRNFSFYRAPGADMMLREDEVNVDIIKQSRVLHFGTLSMTHDVVEKATVKAIETAKDSGLLLSFDPNLRPPLWDSMNRAKQKIDYGCSVSDIVKIETDELRFLTGCDDTDKAVEMFKTRYPNVALLTVTAGRSGSRAYYKNIYAEAPTFLNVKTIDTTGAGDTFCACCIDWFLNNGGKEVKEAELRNMLVFANAAASLVTCKKGALLSMPEISDINNLIKENENNE